MKSDKGITLVALVIYIIVMIIVIGIMSTVLDNFYKNTNSMQADTEEILQFNNFNTYFLKEIKTNGNSVDSISNEGKYILFSSGNSFSFNNDKIYYNDIEICKQVQDMTISYGKVTNDLGEEVEDNTVINITISFKEFSKSIKYKVEEIY